MRIITNSENNRPVCTVQEADAFLTNKALYLKINGGLARFARASNHMEYVPLSLADASRELYAYCLCELDEILEAMLTDENWSDFVDFEIELSGFTSAM